MRLPQTLSRTDSGHDNTELKSIVVLFFSSLARIPVLLIDAFRPGPKARFGIYLKRWAIMLVFLPLFLTLQVMHWIGFILDELFFPSYHHINIRRPVFIIGPPRSGTTHLHRVLARDTHRFTTFSTWELFLAPSIIQKKVLRLILDLDRRLDRPLVRLVYHIEGLLLQQTDSMHPSTFKDPEEDYFLMCMTLSCSGLFLLFPTNRRFWRYAFFDKRLPERDKQLTLLFYKVCLKKHLFMATQNKRFLSKNASFNPWLEHLEQTFPDASFLVCMRDPLKNIPSMLSVANAARYAFGGPRSDPVFNEHMFRLMKHHYRVLLHVLPRLSIEKWKLVPIQQLHRQLRSCIWNIYDHLDLFIKPDFDQTLVKLDQKSRNFKSSHRYTLKHFGLDESMMKREFQFAQDLLQSALKSMQTLPSELPGPAADSESGSKPDIGSTVYRETASIRNERSEPCRILILSDAIPDRNGVGTYYRDLMDYLNEFVGQVEMIPAKANCAFRVSGLSMRMPGDYTQRIHFPNIPRIERRVKEVRPDVIVAPTLGPFGFFAYALAKRYKTRLIVGHHTAYDKLTQLYWSGVRAHVSTRFMENMSRFLMRSADAVVATADDMAMDALKSGAKKVCCVGTTVAKPFFQQVHQPYSGEIKTILYAGRLAAEKNVWAVLDAARSCPNQTFLIAGEGPERKALEVKAKILSNVRLLGWLSREQLLHQIDRSDLLVLPSHIESFGTVALEGMARCRPVLVSHQCGILEWPELADGLYRIREKETLASAMKRITSDDPETRKQKIESAYNLTRKTNEQTLSQWLDILYGNACEIA
jgi:glycosyltransferase involved in cell wall biosynthesis